MKTKIQSRIENLVTDNRGYMKIPTNRIFGNKKALKGWLEFANYRKIVDKCVNDAGLELKNDKLPFLVHCSIVNEIKLNEMIEIVMMYNFEKMRKSSYKLIQEKVYSKI